MVRLHGKWHMDEQQMAKSESGFHPPIWSGQYEIGYELWKLPVGQKSLVSTPTHCMSWASVSPCVN